MRFAIFWLHLSKLLRLPRKVIPGHTKCCTCHAKSPQQTWRSDAPKCNPSQHLWWTCLLYCAWHATCIFAGPLQMSHACHRFWKCHKTLTFCSFLTRCTIPCACHAKRHLNVKKCTFSTSQLPKVVRSWCVFYIWLRNVLRATTACTSSTSELPKVVRSWCAFYILTSTCRASRHNGVQFFISHLASWLRTRRFSEPYFSTLRSHKSLEKYGKTQCFATFLPLRSPGSSFFWDFLFFDLLSSSLLFSDSSHLCFSCVHIVGSLTSKLPSVILKYYR